MKILLVYPVPARTHWPRGQFRAHWIPTGLAYICSGLKRAGHHVKVIHREEQLTASGLNWQSCDGRLRSVMDEFRPDMVGISAVTPAMPDTKTIASWAKEICGPQVIVVAGGPHPTALPERTLLECPDVDVVVVGEGEHTMAELADNGPSKDTPGLVFRQDGELLHTPPRPLAKTLDSLGLPDYSEFNMDFHLQPNPWLVRWIPQSGMNIHTSRGCTNKCSFCAGHVVFGTGVRYHSIDYVIERLQDAVRLGAKLILFEDDTLAADDNRLIQLCEAIKERGLHKRIGWQCCMRADQVTQEGLAVAKSAGCIQIEYGFESGSDRMLKRIAKKTSVQMNRRAVRLTREAGIRIYANIMIGLPGETEEDFKASVDFLHWAKPEIISGSCMQPLPGTAVYNDLPQEVRDSMDWKDYTYAGRPPAGVNVTAMPAETFEKCIRQFFKYLIRPTMNVQILRDTLRNQREERRKLRKKIFKFALQHPLRAVRLPC